jgi:hypothetical protein
MSLTENLLASIQAELDVLKATEAAPQPAPTPEPAPAPVAVQPTPTPAPAVEDDANVPPVIRFAREQARKLQGK